MKANSLEHFHPSFLVSSETAILRSSILKNRNWKKTKFYLLQANDDGEEYMLHVPTACCTLPTLLKEPWEAGRGGGGEGGFGVLLGPSRSPPAPTHTLRRGRQMFALAPPLANRAVAP